MRVSFEPREKLGSEHRGRRDWHPSHPLHPHIHSHKSTSHHQNSLDLWRVNPDCALRANAHPLHIHRSYTCPSINLAGAAYSHSLIVEAMADDATAAGASTQAPAAGEAAIQAQPAAQGSSINYHFLPVTIFPPFHHRTQLGIRHVRRQ